MKILIDTNKPEQVAELLKFLKVEKQDIAPHKPTPEARFAQLIQGLRIETKKGYPDSDFYCKSNDVYFEHNKKRKILWCNYYKVWAVFKKEFDMKYDEIQAFIKVRVARHLKMKDVTPYQDWGTSVYMVKRHLKMKDVTPYC